MSLNTMKCLLETNKLIGSNFPDWLRNLRLVLRMDKIEYVLDEPISDIPDEASEAFKSFDKDRHKKHIDDATSAQCIMLGSMTSELHRQHEYMFPYEMRVHLESLYAAQAKTTEYEILRDLFRSKMHEGDKVSDHVLKMIGLIERCAMIGIKLPENVPIHILDLSHNNFRFENIPKWIGGTSMKSLRLAKCGIKMKMDDWKPAASFVEIDVSENELTGTPLPLLQNQTRLEGFRASGNKLRFDLKQLKIGRKLKYLDISNNLAFGNVPGIVSMLQDLNVSRNHLCGRLPATKFPASAFLGNDCLCGAPLPPCKT